MIANSEAASAWRRRVAARRGVGRFRPAAGALAALAIVASVLAACSSAPKTPAIVVEAKNRAAEYAELGNSFLARGRMEEALSFHEKALRENRSVDNVEGIASSLNSIGRIYIAAGMLDLAELELADALEYGRMAGSDGQRALALANLGETRWLRGKPEEALELFERAMPLAARSDAVRAIVLHDRAVVLRALERKAEARADFLAAQAINQKLSRWTELAANLYALAGLTRSEGQLVDALVWAEKALEADKRAEHSPGIAADLEASGMILRELGRKEEAYDRYRRSFDVWLAADRKDGTRRSLEALAALADELDLAPEAAKWRSLLASLEKVPD
jgi:tetratricopeptide (TPR) repeat protein